MLAIMDQPEKDMLLDTNLFREMKVEKEVDDGFGKHKDTSVETKIYTIDEIEKIPYFKIMLNSGCNCMLKDYSDLEGMDEKEFRAFDGKIELSDHKRDMYISSDAFRNICIIEKWKTLSLEEYLSLVDEEKTEFLKALVNDKETDPLKYFEYMERTQGRFLD